MVLVVVWVVCVPGTPAPPEPPEPAPPAEVPDEVPPEDEPEEAPVLELPDEADDELEPDPLVVVVVVDVDAVAVGGALLVGTVSVGAPAVFATDEPPPQAETPTASATPAERAAMELVMLARREVTARTSGPERVHSTPAVRAVV